jgi:hypothetical protein
MQKQQDSKQVKTGKKPTFATKYKAVVPDPDQEPKAQAPKRPSFLTPIMIPKPKRLKDRRS